MLITLFLLLLETPTLWERSNEDFSQYIPSFHALVVTEHEDIYLLDSREQRIFHLDANGREKNRFGRKGEGPGEMNSAYRLQYHPGLKALFLYSWRKPELYAFALDGKPLAYSIPSKHAPIVLDENRRVFIDGPETKTEADQGAVIVLENFSTQTAQPIYKNNATRHQDPARAKNNQGEAVTTFPWYTTSLLAASPDLRWLVVGSNSALDFHIYDIQQQQMTGHIEDKAVKRPQLLAEELAENGTKIRLGNKIFRAKDFWQPDYKPPVQKVFFDTEGRVWVALTLPWQAKERHYRVYDQNGTSLGTLTLPASSTILHASGSHLWVTRHDREEDVRYLLKRTYTLASD